MGCRRFVSILAVAGVFGACFIGISSLSQTEPGGGMSLLKQEMLACEETFEAIINALIFDNMEVIGPTIPPLQKAREKIERAIRAGEKITLAKNQDQFAEFMKLDDKFHKDLNILLEAAEKGHKKVAEEQTHKLLDSCVVCHQKFRKRPSP